jgi:cytochrome c oxidase cbb3-type subunit 3
VTFIIRSIFFLIFIPLHSVVEAAPNGESLYNKHCSVCHGDNGDGGVGVPLSLPSFMDSVSDEYLKNTIRYGRPGRIMPSFPELSDAQINAIAQHLRSWSDKPAAKHDPGTVLGDVINGKKMFARQCAQCHGKSGRGGKGTGVTFSRKRDLPIIAPALNNSGFLASATDAMLKNTLLFGREGTPMQSSKETGLSKDDIDDLVSYIRSFESRPVSANKKNESPVIIVDSPYSLEETVENLKQSIADQNFTLIRTEPFERGFVDEGKESKKQIVLHFCNFNFLFEALAIDPRVGMFLPCRVTVVENKGKVQIMTINPLQLSKLFNNEELDTACKEMHKVYSGILEDAVL